MSSPSSMVALFIALFSLSAIGEVVKFASPSGQLQLKIYQSDELSLELAHLKHGRSLYIDRINLVGSFSSPAPLSTQWRLQQSRSSPNGVQIYFARGDHRVEIFLSDKYLSYRHILKNPKPFRIDDEPTIVTLNPDYTLRAQHARCGVDTYDCYHSSYEYLYKDLLNPIPQDLIFSPLIAHDPSDLIYITEMNQRDYPALHFRQVADHSLKFDFARMPTRVVLDIQRWTTERVIERDVYLSTHTAGTHNFPWRIFFWGDSHVDLLENNFNDIFMRNEIRRVPKPQWVEYGFGTDDWIVDTLIDLPRSELGFEPGINTETYRYYIDFAARFGLKFVIIDDGWSLSTELDRINPHVDLSFLKRYAHSKGIKLILWVQHASLIKDLELKLDRLKHLGASGIKVDFFDRDDQPILQFQERLYHETYARELMVLVHGVARPTGQDARLPHILGFEAGRGHEYNKFGYSVIPQHKLNLALFRSPQGFFDWEGASFRNLWPREFILDIANPYTQGTRASELAVYLFYESRVQILAGNLGDYVRNPELTKFLARIPIEWDERVGISARLDDHAVCAKRQGQTWYISGLSGRYDEGRPDHNFKLPVHRLMKGRYRVTGVTDCNHPNAPATCTSLIDETVEITDATTYFVSMRSSGGFILRFDPIQENQVALVK